MVSSLFGMARGFETLYALRKSPVYRKSRDPHERARFVWTHLLDPLTAQDTARPGPFFAYLHQLDPHSPYDPPAKYRRQFTRAGAGDSIGAPVEHFLHLRERAGDFSPEQIDSLGLLYKAEVAFMDDYVGEIMFQLESRGLSENTLVIFTSDHGEEFFDHRSLGHGHTVYDELLRVPLIMRLDGVLPAGTRVAQPVELIDLAPTVLDLFGLETPSVMRGRSLLPSIEDPGKIRRGVSLATSARPSQYSIAYGNWKLIRHDAVRGKSKERVELFHLARDPRETRDVSLEEPIAATALRQMLAWHLARDRMTGEAQAPRATLDPETLKALKAMGYVE
jgi:arylsulfatase A-like enzyme